MFVLHACVCQSTNLIFYFFVAVWIAENSAEQYWNNSVLQLDLNF